MKNIIFLMLSLFLLMSNPVNALQNANLPHQELKMEQQHKKLKKQKGKQLKKSRAKGQGIRNMPSFLSAIFGAGSIAAVIGAIYASFALSSLGVVVMMILGLGLGIFAVFNGIRGVKIVRDNPNLKGTQGGAIVGLFLGGLSLLVLLAMTLGAIFG